MEEKGIENVSVKDILLEMRTQRMGLIQTHDQLKFSYIAIIQGLKVDWNASDDVSAASIRNISYKCIEHLFNLS